MVLWEYHERAFSIAPLKLRDIPPSYLHERSFKVKYNVAIYIQQGSSLLGQCTGTHPQLPEYT